MAQGKRQAAAMTKRSAEISTPLRLAAASLSTGTVEPHTRVTSRSDRLKRPPALWMALLECDIEGVVPVLTDCVDSMMSL